MVDSLSVIVIGFIAMSAQVLFLREFLVSFGGNELSLGVALAAWLASAGVSAFALGRQADRIRNKRFALAVCFICLAVLLFLCLLEIRSIRDYLGVAAGEVVSLPRMAEAGLLVFLPACGLLGFMFSLSCRLSNAGKTYLLESLGSMAGGFSVSLYLIRVYGVLQIIAVLAALALSAALLLLRSAGTSWKVLSARVCSILLFGFLAYLSFSPGWQELESASLKARWRGSEVIDNRNSLYGSLTLIADRGQVSFFYDGMRIYSVPDKPSAEEKAHLALLQHQAPRRVLMAGAGIEAVRETLSEPVDELDYVELDPLNIEMARSHLAPEYLEVFLDKRLSVHNIDARRFIKYNKKKYDCVIINLGDPLTAQLNRYYTLEFFRELKSILKQRGVFSISLSSSENYIRRENALLLRSIYAALKEVFGEVKAIPGDTAYFLASDTTGALTYDYELLVRRIEERGLRLSYVCGAYLFSRLSAERVDYLERILKQRYSGPLNSDERPISYYYANISWLSRFRHPLVCALLAAVTARLIWVVVAALAIVMLFAGRKRGVRGAVVLSCVTGGFSAMGFQMIILLAFQSIYGIVFYKLGVILTSFMLGLVLGAGRGMNSSSEAALSRFRKMQLIFVFYALFLCTTLRLLALRQPDILLWFGANLFFPLLSAAAGYITGYQFPLANNIYSPAPAAISSTGGLIYGVDLLGSCLGALLVSAFWVPILGIVQTCFAIALFNLVAFYRLKTTV